MIRTIEVGRITGVAIITASAGLTAVLMPMPSRPGRVTISPPIGVSEAIAYAPVVMPASVAITPQLLSAGASTFAPTIAPGVATVQASLFTSAGRTFPPTVQVMAAGSVQPILHASEVIGYAPSVSPGAVSVTPALMPSRAVGYAPAITPGHVSVVPPALSSGAAVFPPVIAPGAVTISPALSASTTATYPPTVAPGAVAIQVATLASTAASYPPTVTIQATGYDSDAQAYFAAMTVQPDATRKGRINDLVVGLKSDGIWAKLDWLVLCALGTAQQALLNARAPSKFLSAVNSPVFTADRGFTGDASSSYLDVGEPLSSASTQMRRDSASAGVWVNQQGGATGLKYHLGNPTGSYRQSIGARDNGSDLFRANDATDDILQPSSTTRVGHRMWSRTGSSIKRGYNAGSLVADLATTSAPTVTTTNGVILRNSTSYAADRVAAFYSGGGMSDAEAAAMHGRLSTFLTAIGAT